MPDCGERDPAQMLILHHIRLDIREIVYPVIRIVYPVIKNLFRGEKSFLGWPEFLILNAYPCLSLTKTDSNHT